MFTKFTIMISVAASLAFTNVAFSQTAPAEPGVENINILATELEFFDTGIVGSTDVGPILAAAAFGDLAKGEHSTWIRIPAGFTGGVHTHAYDMWVAVVSGVAVNTGVGAEDVALPAGSFWFQPAGKPHYTNCISSVECVVFASQNGAFDSVAVTK